MTTSLIDPIQAEIGIGASGAIGVGSAPAGTVLLSFQFELGEGSNQSTDARNLVLW